MPNVQPEQITVLQNFLPRHPFDNGEMEERLFPTLCHLTGLPTPRSMDGKSFAPLLKNPKTKIHDSVFFAYQSVAE